VHRSREWLFERIRRAHREQGLSGRELAVRFKVSRRDGRVMNAVPEFDDCSKLAAANNLPVKEVQAIAARAYSSQS